MGRFGVILLAALGLVFPASQQEVPKSTPPPAKTAENRGGGITIEAEGLSEEAKEALKEYTRKLLSKAVHAALNKAVKELEQKLGLADEVDRGAFNGIDQFDRPHQDGDRFSVWLLRPGSPGQAPQTVILAKDGKLTLRFTRVIAPVTRPVAVLTRVRLSGGQATQTEIYMEYDGKSWRTMQPKEREVRLGG
jgi:hypothetical protein